MTIPPDDHRPPRRIQGHSLLVEERVLEPSAEVRQHLTHRTTQRVIVLEALLHHVDHGERPMIAPAVDGNDDEVLAEHIPTTCPFGHPLVIVALVRLGERGVEVRLREGTTGARGFALLMRF